MKNLLSLVLVSVLGGAIALGSYKTFFEKEAPVYMTETTETTPFVKTNYNSNLNALEQTDFTIAAEKTIHTVVHVKNVTTSTGNPTLADLMYGRMPTRKQLGTGSGVIISPDGYIITNNHVIEGSEMLSVTLNNNKTYNAEIIGTDAKTDIALLKIKTNEELPYTTFADSDTVKIGEWVLAVGNPFNLTSTVTAGIVSAKSRDLSGNNSQSFIQTDAAVNPGNSGGALVNTNGDLIGINTAISSQTGSYIGYSFAVPSNIAKKVVQDIMEFGNVQNGILGVSGGILTSKTADDLNVKFSEGFYVSQVDEDSGAMNAGLQEGDIIKKIDNVTISKFSDLFGYLSTKSPRDVVNIIYVRDGDTKSTKVTLTKSNMYVLDQIGVLRNAKKDDLRRFKVDNGVKISDLDRNNERTLKQYYGIDEGFIITKINNSKINTIEDVKRIVENRATNEPLIIEIVNNKGEAERYRL
jgi:serine protease Do